MWHSMYTEVRGRPWVFSSCVLPCLRQGFMFVVHCCLGGPGVLADSVVSDFFEAGMLGLPRYTATSGFRVHFGEASNSCPHDCTADALFTLLP